MQQVNKEKLTFLMGYQKQLQELRIKFEEARVNIGSSYSVDKADLYGQIAFVQEKINSLVDSMPDFVEVENTPAPVEETPFL